MFNLSDSNISYFIFSPEKESNTNQENQSSCERACSILYSKEYTILSLNGHYNDKYEKSYLAIPNKPDNDNLRKDLIYLIDHFDQECAIIKYTSENHATKLMNNGKEIPMSIAIYNSDLNNKTYLYNGVSFSFIEEKKYHYPKNKEELHNGMSLEFFNNSKWVKRCVEDLNTEYTDLYRLLMKYNKVRFILD